MWQVDPTDVDRLEARLDEDVLFPTERQGKVIDFHVHFSDLSQSGESIAQAVEDAYLESICLLAPIDTEDKQQILRNVIAQSRGKVIGFALISKLEGDKTAQAIVSLHKEGVIKGVKILPNLLSRYPGDKDFFPVYQAASDLGLPILFHCGIIGGLGAWSEYSRPVHFEHVARGFPKLNIVLAHIGWPWCDEAIGVTFMTPNIYLDISTGPPRVYKEEAIKKATLVCGENKLIYGSDVVGGEPINSVGLLHHVIDTRIMLQKIGIPRRIEAKIMRENARVVLKLK